MNNLLYYQRFAHQFGQGISRVLSRCFSFLHCFFAIGKLYIIAALLLVAGGGRVNSDAAYIS